MDNLEANITENRTKKQEYMKKYMYNRYHNDIENVRAYNNSLKYKNRNKISDIDFKKYGIYLADVAKLRKIIEKLPKELFYECLEETNIL